jgi:dienelactone hydrolase
VTNRDFKRFLDEGGYEREEFWRELFVSGDRVLSRHEAMALLVDTVGVPGPAGWEMGEYPKGDDDHPVAGISWYEAAAYAAWAGKALPTIFHWSRVAFTFSSAQIAPPANLAGRATVPVGSTRSVNRFGIHDLAGNVREWILNSIDRPGERFILGGGWNDPGYAFVDAYAQPAFDRSVANGFRCIRALEPEPNLAQLARSIPVAFRDFRAEQPVPDGIFDFFRRQFHYDRKPIEAVPLRDEEIATGRWQTVEVAAAYGAERMQLHLFLPARGRPPYQTVVLFPGSLALHNRVFNLNEYRRLDFLARSGRALLLPVYKGTYERGGEMKSDYPEETAFYKDHVIMWGKDLGRAIDFIETRDDLDAERIAYFGTSWGGALGAIMPAIEPRIRANILYVAGLCFQRALPEADQFNYVTRVTQPTLMLNGELDFFFPAETSQRPMFDLLGTPAADKKRLTYERGHTVPKTDLIRESVAWLDRYLGPVVGESR